MPVPIFNYQTFAKRKRRWRRRQGLLRFQFSKRGFSFIDVMVGTVLVLIVFAGIFGAYQLAVKVVSQSKARVIATALANQKLELARNLSYDSVGTLGGIPAGLISETETIKRNDIDFTVKTTVVYVDDSFDGVAPADTLANDYKRIKIKVSWPGRYPGELFLITDVSPRGVEEELGGGTLYLVVFDALGIGVGQASIHIVNSQVTPQINAWYQTDAFGELVLAGAPVSEEAYQITVTKSGFSTDRTYGREEITTPAKPHGSVYEGKLTEISFSIDRLSSMTVSTRGTRGQGYPPVHNVSFKLQGAKTIGENQGVPVYKYSQNKLTNGPAEIYIPNLEWDSYSFFVDKQTTGLDLVDIETPPGATSTQPVDLLPNTAKEVRLILKAENTLLVKVQNASTSEPLFGAAVNLSNVGLGYNQTQPTGEDGRTFFIPLTQATYQLTAELAGFTSSTVMAAVSGDATSTINLMPTQ